MGDTALWEPGVAWGVQKESGQTSAWHLTPTAQLHGPVAGIKMDGDVEWHACQHDRACPARQNAGLCAVWDMCGCMAHVPVCQQMHQELWIMRGVC